MTLCLAGKGSADQVRSASGRTPPSDLRGVVYGAVSPGA
jgi:hypothetical protein